MSRIKRKYYQDQLAAFSLAASGLPFRVVPLNIASRILQFALQDTRSFEPELKRWGSIEDNIQFMRDIKLGITSLN